MIYKKDNNLIRKSERISICRFCDKTIARGETMVSFYSSRNQGMWIHLHTSCVGEIHDEVLVYKQMKYQTE